MVDYLLIYLLIAAVIYVHRRERWVGAAEQFSRDHPEAQVSVLRVMEMQAVMALVMPALWLVRGALYPFRSLLRRMI
jgi:hypothetical protein